MAGNASEAAMGTEHLETGPIESSPVKIDSVAISCCTGYSACGLVYDALPPILPILSAHFGGGERGDTIAQLASTFPIAGMAIAGLFAGLLIERLGIKVTLLGALILFALSGSAGVAIDSAVPLLITRLMVGLATGVLMTAGASLIAASYFGHSRSRMTGWALCSGAVSAITFVLISGWVATISWRAPFLLHGVFGLIFIIPVLMMGTKSLVVSAEVAATEGFFRSWAHLKPAIPAFFLIFTLVLIGNLFNIQLAFLFVDIGFSKSTTIAQALAVYSGSIAVANMTFGRVEARLNILSTNQLGFALLAAGALICGSSSTIPPMILGIAIAGYGMGLETAGLITLIMRRVGPPFTPRALGVGTTTMYLGGSIAPLVFLPIHTMTSIAGIYYLASASLFAGVIIYQLNRGRMARNMPGRA